MSQTQAQCSSPFTFSATATMLENVVHSRERGTDVVPPGTGSKPKVEGKIWFERPDLHGAGLQWGKVPLGEAAMGVGCPQLDICRLNYSRALPQAWRPNTARSAHPSSFTYMTPKPPGQLGPLC